MSRELQIIRKAVERGWLTPGQAGRRREAAKGEISPVRAADDTGYLHISRLQGLTKDTWPAQAELVEDSPPAPRRGPVSKPGKRTATPTRRTLPEKPGPGKLDPRLIAAGVGAAAVLLVVLVLAPPGGEEKPPPAAKGPNAPVRDPREPAPAATPRSPADELVSKGDELLRLGRQPYTRGRGHGSVIMMAPTAERVRQFQSAEAMAGAGASADIQTRIRIANQLLKLITDTRTVLREPLAGVDGGAADPLHRMVEDANTLPEQARTLYEQGLAKRSPEDLEAARNKFAALQDVLAAARADEVRGNLRRSGEPLVPMNARQQIVARTPQTPVEDPAPPPTPASIPVPPPPTPQTPGQPTEELFRRPTDAHGPARLEEVSALVADLTAACGETSFVRSKAKGIKSACRALQRPRGGFADAPAVISDRRSIGARFARTEFESLPGKEVREAVCRDRRMVAEGDFEGMLKLYEEPRAECQGLASPWKHCVIRTSDPRTRFAGWQAPQQTGFSRQDLTRVGFFCPDHRTRARLFADLPRFVRQ